MSLIPHLHLSLLFLTFQASDLKFLSLWGIFHLAGLGEKQSLPPVIQAEHVRYTVYSHAQSPLQMENSRATSGWPTAPLSWILNYK